MQHDMIDDDELDSMNRYFEEEEKKRQASRARVDDIVLSEDQQVVYDTILKWLDDPRSVPTREFGLLTTGGYAGTGKSTVLSKLVRDRGDLRFACAAYTGKATGRLAMLLGDAAVTTSTIHRLIYNPVEREGQTRFDRKQRLGEEVDRIIIDEGSMVSSAVFEDVRALGIHVLMFGDHGQLPPVDGVGSYMMEPDLRLEKIHRQAEGNPIIALSKIVREKGAIPVPPPKGIRHISFRKFQEEMVEFAAHASPAELLETVALTYRNSTRVKINTLVRHARFGADVDPHKPLKGEAVICLRNDAAAGVFNGMRGIATEVISPRNYLTVHFAEEKITGTYRVLPKQFGREKTLASVAELKEAGAVMTSWRDAPMLFDYGYAMTVHKAQGSGFKRVYLCKEKPLKTDEDTYARWCYTAVTRAIEELVIVAV